MAKELGLTSLRVHASRGEAVLARERFDTVTARAVASVEKLCRWAAPCWSSMDRMLWVKGLRWQEEIDEARQAGALTATQVRPILRYPLGSDAGEGAILEARAIPRGEKAKGTR